MPEEATRRPASLSSLSFSPLALSGPTQFSERETRECVSNCLLPVPCRSSNAELQAGWRVTGSLGTRALMSTAVATTLTTVVVASWRPACL